MSEKSQRHSLQHVPEYGEDGIKIINTELKLLQLRKMKSIIRPAYLVKAREINKWMNESNMRQKQGSSKSTGSDPSILSYQRRLQVSS